MQQKDAKFTPGVDFKEQTPEVLIAQKRPAPLYEKAFLSREDTSKTEFARNTTTWD